MSKRKAEVVLLCEDSQQDCFFGKVLNSRRKYRKLRRLRPKRGSGSGEQFVRDHFGPEARTHRARAGKGLASGLLAVMDADTGTVQRHYDELLCQLTPPRGGDERIAIFIPKRNIETWIRFLDGAQVNETQPYPKLSRAGDCAPAVDCFLRIAQAGPPADCPPSLRRAIEDEVPRLP